MELTADLILSVLLLITIGLSVYLASALGRLRRDRVELTNLIEALNVSSSQAHNGIEHLRQTTELVGRQLDKTIDQARALRSELCDITTRAEAVEGRLEVLVGAPPRSSQNSELPPSRLPAQLPHDRMIGKSAAERELLRALRMKQG